MTISRRRFLHTSGVALSAPFLVKFLGEPAEAALASAKYLVPFNDPRFGNKIVKVTNPLNAVPGLGLTWEKVARHHYSIDQAWNADQTLLMMGMGTPGRLFLNGSTYKPLFNRKHPGMIRWHRTNPDLMVFVGNAGVGYWNVRKDLRQPQNPLTGYTDLNFGENKGNLSDSGNVLAITAKRRSDGKKVMFAYNLSTARKYPDINMSAWYDIGWTTISPKGTYIVSYSRKTSSSNNQRLIFTLDGRLVQNWTDYERPGHGDFMIDGNGYEVAVGRSKADDFKLIKRRLVDGKISLLSDSIKASHMSARSLRSPGWAFGSFVKDGSDASRYLPYTNEVTAISTDGTQKVRRLATHNSTENNYVSEVHASPSPDGKRAIFASNWGVSGGPVAAYVATFT
jgi:hypothetical protein